MSQYEEVRAVAFFNEDLDEIKPVWTIHIDGRDRGWFDEGPAVTILIGDKIAGCIGVAKVFDGYGIAWCLMDRRIPAKYKRRIAIICRERLDWVMDKFNFHRIQADIAKSFDKGRRFVEFMGLKHEGVMKCFGPDKEDYDRYAIVRC